MVAEKTAKTLGVYFILTHFLLIASSAGDLASKQNYSV